ncbi:MAG: 2-C-methyl-D-erythritol 2,4-cyclodiphosphate synthase [Candidatus Eisenbacteria bacterium]
MLRTGIGYDIHRLAEGRALMIGCVELPSDKGLLGHSDGDVLAHAIIDAILGACSLGDIGYNFPDDDPELKGIAGRELLERIHAKIARMGRVEHIDSTVVVERPKLAPHIEAMREAIADALNIPIDKISVKAKTAEGLGPVGREEAIEAYAVALVDL